MRRHIIRAVLPGLLLALASPTTPAVALSAQPTDGARGTIWITDRQNDRVAVYDRRGGGLLATLSTEGIADPLSADEPNDVEVAAGKAYATNEASGTISVFDVASRTLLRRLTAAGPMPHHVTASRNGRLVAYGVYGTREVGLIDTRSDTIRRLTVSNKPGEIHSHAPFFSRDGRTVYVANELRSGSTQLVGTVSAVDLQTGVVRCELDVGVRSSEVVVTRDGKKGYVSVRNELVIKEIDFKHCALTGRSVNIGEQVDTLDLQADQKKLSAGLRGPAPLPSRVAVVNLVSFETADIRFWTIPGGTLTGHQWTSPSGRFTYAAFEGEGAGVALIDHQTGVVLKLPPIGGRPHGIDVTGPCGT
jgi:DNA-binding beta-propeller fold protein YncE